MTRRRQLLKAGALGATASFTTGAYAQTQPSVRWRMAALYPRSLDTCYGSTEQMCKRVAELTNGKFTIFVEHRCTSVVQRKQPLE